MARAQLDSLAPDSDDDTRTVLAELLACRPGASYPSTEALVADAPIGPRRALHVLDAARHELCNLAQVDVLQRLDRLLDATSRDAGRPPA